MGLPVTSIEVVVLLYVDGVQQYVSKELAEHIPSDPEIADLISADVLRAARRVCEIAEEKYRK